MRYVPAATIGPVPPARQGQSAGQEPQTAADDERVRGPTAAREPADTRKRLTEQSAAASGQANTSPTAIAGARWCSPVHPVIGWRPQLTTIAAITESFAAFESG
jgi:hypothetical protein